MKTLQNGEWIRQKLRQRNIDLIYGKLGIKQRVDKFSISYETK
jgi:hypothetical protein